MIQINPLRRGRSYPAIDHRRVPEPIANGSGRVVRLRFPREETLPVATLLALAGGYIDAYTWITHQVFANAQTANMLVVWIHAMAREWAKALHYVPFLTAFVLGVIMASWLRRLAGANAGPINLFPRVEFWAYSSVMPTTNLRQTIEGFLIAVTGSLDPHHFRRSGVFAMILAAFGTGAATGAYVTVQVPALTLNILVTFL